MVQFLVIFCAIFIISSPDSSSKRFLEVMLRLNCFKIFCKVFRLYEKILLTVEISSFDTIFFFSKRITTESTFGIGVKFDFLTFIRNFILNPWFAKTDIALCYSFYTNFLANSACTIITALENFFCSNHSMANLLFEYGRLEIKIEKSCLELKPSACSKTKFE